MKNIVVALFVVCLVVFGFFIFRQNDDTLNEGYLRIHIRANSNSEADQDVKYAVKEQIVNFLTPLISNSTEANEAMAIVNANLHNLDAVATNVLAENGHSYTAKARLVQEYFPTRTYDETTLEDGLYDALIIELGEAKGDNWWCVVYPPLCFLSSGSGNGKVEYDSVIYNFIKNKMKNR